MATETIIPDTELADSGLVASVVTDHDGDPDSDNSTTAATGNNTDTIYHVGFGAPSGNLTTGAGLQEFRVGSEEFDSGQTGIPQIQISLYEAGTLVRAGSLTNVETFAVESFTWDASELADVSGVDVECYVYGKKSGGAPGARNALNIGQIEWNATYTEGSAVPVLDGGMLTGGFQLPGIE